MHLSTASTPDTTSIMKQSQQSQHEEIKTILFPLEMILFYIAFILETSFFKHVKLHKQYNGMHRALLNSSSPPVLTLGQDCKSAVVQVKMTWCSSTTIQRLKTFFI